jgi:hypothetical protein
MRKEFLADCAASKIIINRCHENLVDDIEPCTSDIYGACGVSLGACGVFLGAVTSQGFITFLRVRMRCYIADTEVSVFSIANPASTTAFARLQKAISAKWSASAQ